MTNLKRFQQVKNGTGGYGCGQGDGHDEFGHSRGCSPMPDAYGFELTYGNADGWQVGFPIAVPIDNEEA